MDCPVLTNVSIPSHVLRIENDTFSGCKSLTNVTIPEAVTFIGEGAFSGCGLKGIRIPESVVYIGRGAFSIFNKSDLYISNDAANRPSNFVIENGVLLEYRGPGGNVEIPKGVIRIGFRAFYRCSTLSSVTIPDSVTSIDDSAFWSCCPLTDLIIPNSVKSIGDSAFGRCQSLTVVSIPESIERIGDFAFYECNSLSMVKSCAGSRESGKEALSSHYNIQDELFSRKAAIGKSAFAKCSSLTEIKIPEIITSICASAFYKCTSLTQLVFPSHLTSIGELAYNGCTSLKSVILPESVTSVESSSFSGCTKIQWIRSSAILKPFGCSFALLLRGNEPAYLAYSSKGTDDNLSNFAKPGCWSRYDQELINNGPIYKYRLSARLLGALGRLMNPVELTEENRFFFVTLLNKNAKNLVLLAEETGDVGIIAELFKLCILDEKAEKAVRKRLAVSAVQELCTLAVL